LLRQVQAHISVAVQRMVYLHARKKGVAMKIKVVLEASEEGGYTVTAPSLPGCISEGDTEEEALENIKEAVELYLEPVDDDLQPADRKMIREIAV
jgi:predicted RNase H-like HicB family nuclease